MAEPGRAVVTTTFRAHVMAHYEIGLATGFGTLVWCVAMIMDVRSVDREQQVVVPKAVEVTYSFCAIAYLSNLILSLLRIVCINGKKSTLIILAIYISLLASLTYTLLWLDIASVRVTMKSVLYLPSRWILYICTMPAIWWILAHISNYPTRRKLYVLWLNWVMLMAGGLATIPSISWGHKVWWMAISCVPFPEICFHSWQMVSDAIDFCPTAGEKSPSVLKFMRFFGLFSYQFFPAIYFAAFDGCIPLYVSEPLWSICDWLLKMVFTTSLMEANFFTVAQHQDYILRLVQEAHSFHKLKQLTLTIERKDQFLASMSHELRTPLNGIIGMAAAISMPSSCLPVRVQSTIEAIKSSGTRLLELINDVLDVAHIRGGNLDLRHESVDLHVLIKGVQELMLPLLRPGVRMYRQIGTLPVIIADGKRVTQILFNLLSNCCKFTESGSIRVTAGLCPRKKMVFVSVRDTGCGFLISQAQQLFTVFEQGDMSSTRRHGGTGLGLHLVQQLVNAHRGHVVVQSKITEGSVFTVYLPLKQPRSHKAQGSRSPNVVSIVPDDLSGPEVDADEIDVGIGVNLIENPALLNRVQHSHDSLADSATLRSHASSHHSQGRTSTESSQNPQGTRGRPQKVASPNWDDIADVVLADKEMSSLPLVSPSFRFPPGGIQVHLFHSHMYGIQRVLSVDDDPVNQMVVANLLQPLGYDIEHAMNGCEAMTSLTSSDFLPDLILLDCMMPGMTGYEVCSLLRERYGYGIPIIMLSANSSSKNVLLSLQQGVNDYFKKPFRPTELTARISSHNETKHRIEVEIEARLPSILLHQPMHPVLEQAVASGHESAAVLLVDTVIMRCSISVMLTNEASAASLVAIREKIRAICSSAGICPCFLAGCSFICYPFPSEASTLSQRWACMISFATRMAHMIPLDMLAAGISGFFQAGLAAGNVQAGVLNNMRTQSRVMLIGHAVRLAASVCAAAPYGSLHIASSQQLDLSIPSDEFTSSVGKEQHLGDEVTILRLAPTTVTEPDQTELSPVLFRQFIDASMLEYNQKELQRLKDVLKDAALEDRRDSKNEEIWALVDRVQHSIDSLADRTTADTPSIMVNSEPITLFHYLASRRSSLADVPDDTCESSGAAHDRSDNQMPSYDDAGASQPESPTHLQANIANFCSQLGLEDVTPLMTTRGWTVEQLATSTESQLVQLGIPDLRSRVRMIVCARKFVREMQLHQGVSGSALPQPS